MGKLSQKKFGLIAQNFLDTVKQERLLEQPLEEPILFAVEDEPLHGIEAKLGLSANGFPIRIISYNAPAEFGIPLELKVTDTLRKNPEYNFLIVTKGPTPPEGYEGFYVDPFGNEVYAKPFHSTIDSNIILQELEALCESPSD